MRSINSEKRTLSITFPAPNDATCVTLLTLNNSKHGAELERSIKYKQMPASIRSIAVRCNINSTLDGKRPRSLRPNRFSHIIRVSTLSKNHINHSKQKLMGFFLTTKKAQRHRLYVSTGNPSRYDLLTLHNFSRQNRSIRLLSQRKPHLQPSNDTPEIQNSVSEIVRSYLRPLPHTLSSGIPK